MKEEVLNKIKDEISYSVKEIAENSGYSYLNCSENQWKDANDFIHEIEDMSTKHLKYCLRELNNSGKFISLSYDNVKNNANLSRHRFSTEDKKIIVMMAKEELNKLFDAKKEKIENELSERW